MTTRTTSKTWEGFYGTETFQMRESGSFHYEVSDPGCLLFPHGGDGGVVPLPFSWASEDGDSPVFQSPGSVNVRIGDRHGTPDCELLLMSDADGRPWTTKDADSSTTSVTLESNGPARVFIPEATCSIKVLR